MTANNTHHPSIKPLTIGIIAGEISGDMLGGDFMQKMNAIHPNIRWVGVGGRQMAAQGLSSCIDMARLSVMGLTEVVKHLPDLFRAKAEILAVFERENIDIFIGIDAPDFNLRIGKALKDKRIFRVQYVSPSVWAWREGRMANIKESSDLVLCLFPFELPVYVKHEHPAVCVGHPLLSKLTPDERSHADIIAEFIDTHRARFNSLDNINKYKPLICVMVGSRHSEINAIAPLLAMSMQKIQASEAGAQFILPLVNAEHAALLKQLISEHASALPAHCYHIVYPATDTAHEGLSISQQCMNISQLVLLASGTATLEALLLHRPMVVVYRVGKLTYHIAKRLVKIPYVSLPNILAHQQTGQPIVPELIQDDATPDAIVHHALGLLVSDAQGKRITKTTQLLRADSHNDPAQSVLDFWAIYSDYSS